MPGISVNLLNQHTSEVFVATTDEKVTKGMRNIVRGSLVVGVFCVSSVSLYASASTIVSEICRREYVEGASEKQLLDETERLRGLGEPGRRALVKLASSDRPEGDRAINFLVRLEDPRARTVARNLLGRRNAGRLQKKRALSTVAFYGDKISEPKVLELFRVERDDGVIRDAIKALHTLRSEIALKALREAVTDPRYSPTRGEIVKALGIPGHDDAVGPLVRLAAEDPAYRHPYARAELMDTLIDIGTERALTQALDIAKTIDRTNGMVRATLAQVVKDLNLMRGATMDPVKTTQIDALVQELSSTP